MNIDPILVVSRWLHLASVIVLVGGTIYVRFILIPAAAKLAEGDQELLHRGLLERWKVFVHSLIGILILTGIYNIGARIHSSPPVALYHMLFGVKFILAMVVFFVASALVGRSKGLEPMRAKRGFWLAFNVVLAAAILLLSNVMRYLPAKPAAAEPAKQAAVQPVK